MNKINRLIFFILLNLTHFSYANEVENIMVRVVSVTPDWMTYSSGADAFFSAAPLKESESLKFYDIAIWEDNNSIQLYMVTNDYYENRPSHNADAEEQVNYRESFAIARVDGFPAKTGSLENIRERSEFLKNVMKNFASILVNLHPDASHHLTYSGHGIYGGSLFALTLMPKHVIDFLSHWTNSLGRKLGVIDFGGPCDKGSFSDLETFSSYADYYIASDLPNGGYTFNNFTIEKYDETNTDLQYHRLFKEHINLVDALKERIDLTRIRYEYSNIDMIQNKVEQGNYLYSCEAFLTFSTAFKAHMLENNIYFYNKIDIYDFLLTQNNDSLLELYNKVIIHQADNRDFFDWEISANGMLSPQRIYETTNLTLNMVEPFVELPEDFIINEGQQVSIAVNAYDIEYDNLTYEWSQLSGPDVLTLIDNKSKNINFIAPDLAIELEISVNDGEHTVTDTIKINDSSVASVNEQDFKKLGINMFPNPSKETVFLQINNELNGDYNILIFDLNGKQILQDNFKKNQSIQQKSIELKGLTKGVYLIGLQTKGYYAVGRLIKE